MKKCYMRLDLLYIVMILSASNFSTLSVHCTLSCHCFERKGKWRIRDFPEGAPTYFWPDFAESCMKMTKTGPRGWGHAAIICLCRSATEVVSSSLSIKTKPTCVKSFVLILSGASDVE